MKHCSYLLFRVLALVVLATSLRAEIGTRVIRTSGFVSGGSPYTAVTFEIQGAGSFGTRLLIQASGTPSPNGSRLDPEIQILGRTTSGNFVLLAGNDDWQSDWAFNGVRTPASYGPALTKMQSLSGAFGLSERDSALAVYATNGTYIVQVYGWFGTTGAFELFISEINEAPALEMRNLSGPYVGVGESPILQLWGNDPDGDEVEFLLDTNGDGVVDFVSPRVASGVSFWVPAVVKFSDPGEKRFMIRVRDSKGAVSAPAWVTLFVGSY